MCGIAGFWSPDFPPQQYDGLLDSMCDSIRHRGPDSRGTWHDDAAGVGLAHVRLAIVDLSPAGHQPMRSADGRYVLVYNGEVYNFDAIRRELDDAGHTPEGGWRGRSDTEVILQAFTVWEPQQVLERLIGMFALALYDTRERRVWLVRDRLGIKPLYYGFCGKSLVFGSELKALRCHPEWSGAIDTGALARYFQLLYVPAPLSIFQGIAKLEPGCLVCFDAADIAARRMSQPRAYWRIADVAARGLADPLRLSKQELVQELDALIRDSVRMRMVADVPLGAFLSGGVDSSTVVALMQAQSDRPVKTFTIGSGHREYDEAAKAAAVARHLGTEHTELIVEPGEALRTIPELPYFYDEPYADVSQIPSLLVSRLARREVTVALSGDGGDELFGGYNRYLAGPRIWQSLGRLPRPVRRGVAALLENGGEGLLAGLNTALRPLLPPSRRVVLLREKLRKVADGCHAAGQEDFFVSLISFWQRPLQLLAPEHRPASLPPLLPEAPCSMEYASWMMFMDQGSYLPDDILTKQDRASMAVALEARVPLLDHRLVEFAWRTPLSGKISNGIGKLPLREVLYQYVPESLIEGPKQGFDLPLENWLRGELRDWAEELLDERRLSDEGLLLPGPVRNAWRTHCSGKGDRHHHLWAVLMFQAWRSTWHA